MPARTFQQTLHTPTARPHGADAVTIATITGGPAIVSASTIAQLRARFGGAILKPGDDGWSDATRIWNGMAARSPALAVQPASPQDVVAAVRFAREHDLLISIKGGGHNIAGTAVADGALLLDMSQMRTVTVDAANRRAHVAAGCQLHDVDRATQAHGLATVLGFISEVGVAGLTLGGGLGYLTRRFGWTVDNLEEVEVVTADGEIRVANQRDHADLFWALRGGGGNFGVVTRFTFRLHPVGPRVVGGLVAWPFERADEILRAYRELTSRAPRELAMWMVMLVAPPAPFIPPEWHGRRLCAMTICYTGQPERADAVLAPLRALGAPVVDLLAERPYVEVQSYLDDTEPKGLHYYWKTEYLASLSDDLLQTLRDLFADCPIPGAQIGMLHLAGALNERAGDDGAVGNRDVSYAVGVNGMWDPSDPRGERFAEWIRAASARVRPFSTGSSYVNFQTADEDEARVRATYGANYERLARIKRAYDPQNVFRVNRNLLPAAP